MTSGPVVLQVLEGENAVAANREVMGATNPADALMAIAKILLNLSKQIRSMGQIAQKMRLLRSAISLLALKSHHNGYNLVTINFYYHNKKGGDPAFAVFGTGFIPVWLP